MRRSYSKNTQTVILTAWRTGFRYRHWSSGGQVCFTPWETLKTQASKPLSTYLTCHLGSLTRKIHAEVRRINKLSQTADCDKNDETKRLAVILIQQHVHPLPYLEGQSSAASSEEEHLCARGHPVPGAELTLTKRGKQRRGLGKGLEPPKTR